MTSNSSKHVFLDIDPTIVEKNLRFAADSTEEEFNKMFQQPEQYPSKLVKPFPGFCIKTREVGSDTKFFVNICHTDAIPPPKDISEKDLQNILESDEISDYRVPMSIGDVRTETDKKGEEARVSDVAIHPDFFNKIERSMLFKNFLITIIFEGLKDKHGIICHDDKIILKNRKAFGTLQVHRIQQREIDEKIKSVEKSVIEEICGADSTKAKPLIETISNNEVQVRTPEYRLFRRRSKPNCLIGEFKFPDILFINNNEFNRQSTISALLCEVHSGLPDNRVILVRSPISAKQLTLDIGEDRIVIESTSKHYLLDIFVPLVIRQASCTSSFNISTKILTVTMPLVGG